MLLAEYEAQRDAERQKNLASEGGPPHFRMVLRRNGVRYTRTVLNAYYDQLITAADVAGYLQMKLKHLPRIEQELAHAGY